MLSVTALVKAGETGLKSQRYETKNCTLPWRETGVVKSQKEMQIECVYLFLRLLYGLNEGKFTSIAMEAVHTVGAQDSQDKQAYGVQGNML